MAPWARSPVDPELYARLAREYGTPFFLYDAGVIRAQLAKLRVRRIRFAQKALSNLHVLRLMRAEGRSSTPSRAGS
jgi:diaminopimelate decarboxylase